MGGIFKGDQAPIKISSLKYVIYLMRAWIKIPVGDFINTSLYPRGDLCFPE